MAMLNIPSNMEDPNYRYKMPRLMSKVEGRGNGIKTNIMNMADIAKALKRPPDYPTKFCGHELGAPAKFENSEGKAIVNGAHEMRDLQILIDKFIEKYVLCPSCSLPEIDIVIQKKTSCVTCKCNACGHCGELDNSHKLATYMVKNPPGGAVSTMGAKKGVSKAERREQKLLKAAAVVPPTVEGATSSTATSNAAVVEKSEKKKKEKSKKTNVEGENSVEGSTEKKKRKKKSKTQTKILEKERLSYDSPEITDVKERMLRFLAAEGGDADVGPTAFFTELRILQVSQDFDSVMRLFIVLEVVCGVAKPLSAELVGEKMPYIRKVVDASMTTGKVCAAFEEFMELKSPGSFENYPFILQKLYNADCVDERPLISRYAKADDSAEGAEKTYGADKGSKHEKHERGPVNNVPGFEKAREAACPFIEWLQEDVEGSEESEEEEEEEEETREITANGGTAGSSNYVDDSQIVDSLSAKKVDVYALDSLDDSDEEINIDEI